MEAKYTAALGRIIQDATPVNQKAIELLFAEGAVETFQKGEIVFHERRLDTFEYIQLEGISHRFNLDNDGNQVTTGIYQNEAVITPHVSRNVNQQNIFSLQALMTSTYLKIPADKFWILMRQHPTIESFAHATMVKEFSNVLSFEVLFRTSTAKDRLLYFRAKYPMLENIIPHTVIASFLGITTVSLSRLRNELT